MEIKKGKKGKLFEKAQNIIIELQSTSVGRLVTGSVLSDLATLLMGKLRVDCMRLLEIRSNFEK